MSDDRFRKCKTCHQSRWWWQFSKSDKARTECDECLCIVDDEELDHDKLLRCPRCRRVWDPGQEDDYRVFEEGEHSVNCMECDFEFEISTSVNYNFKSPAMQKLGETQDEV
jgi:hypothetical protein